MVDEEKCPICKSTLKTMRLFSDLERKRENHFRFRQQKSLGIGERIYRCKKCLSTFSRGEKRKLINKGSRVSDKEWKTYESSLLK